MVGEQLIAMACAYEDAAFNVPEPYKNELKAKAMHYWHVAALDEYTRRIRGDKRDDVHMGYK